MGMIFIMGVDKGGGGLSVKIPPQIKDKTILK